MSARISLQPRVEQYLRERRLLGFKLRSMGHGLPSFARYVADVLRHRSLNTSMIYAKVDQGALSGVALPWPGSAT